MEIPTAREQQQYKEDADEIKNSIIQKRGARVKITSLNTQRFIVGELGSIFWYFIIAGLLLLVKQIQSNQVSILFIVAGFCATLIVLYIFGVSVINQSVNSAEFFYGKSNKFFDIFQIHNTAPLIKNITIPCLFLYIGHNFS